MLKERLRKCFLTTICVLLMLVLLSGCSIFRSSQSVISIPSSGITTLKFDKPIVLDNGKIKVTIPEVINTGDKFGLNGRLSDSDKAKFYCLRLELSVDNLSNQPVKFDETTLSTSVNDKELAHSGLGTAMDESAKNVMTINGAVVTIESNQSKKLYIFFVVPKDAREVNLKLN